MLKLRSSVVFLPAACAALAVLGLTGCTFAPRVTVISHSRVFGSSIPTVDGNGAPNPLAHLDLGRETFAVTRRFPIDESRFLEVRSGAGWLDDRDYERLAEQVRACYASVEQATGRRVPRSTLFFLLAIDTASNSYAIRYELSPAELDVFAWASLLRFEPGERIAVEPVAPSVWHDGAVTLAHELTHEALATTPLARDENGEARSSTRWFDDGTAEWVAERFGRERDPELMRRFREEVRQLGSVLEIDAVRERVFEWPAPASFFGESGDPGPPPWEFELYGASLLVMEAWLRHTTLPEILDRIDASAEPVDRAALFRILRETTGLDPAALLEQARQLGREHASGSVMP